MSSAVMATRMRPVVLACAALALAGLGLLPSVTTASADGAAAYSQTKKLARYNGTADEVGMVGDPNEVTVKADVTTQLQGRERVHISWSGARPSGGRATNPFAEGGLNQEYPVVILQCRGQGKAVSRETCWTNTWIQRSQISADPSAAVWTRDLFAADSTRELNSGARPFPKAACSPNSGSNYSHVTPFLDSKGKLWSACTNETLPAESGVGAAFPAADQAVFTKGDGTGEALFEVRTAIENQSLGCSHVVDCSIVVIPITGISCLDQSNTGGAVQADRECRKGGQIPPGDPRTDIEPDPGVTARYWWAESNWRNRFQIPIEFGLPPGACDALDPRAPTPFFGSELLHQAAIQWAPAYCLNKKRFKWQANGMADEAAFSLMQQGEAVAANVSGQREATGTDKVAYAPTAITGFSISYVIDKPKAAGEYTNLKLNARLLAKLLSQSYYASNQGRAHKGLGDNPKTLIQDPEFQRLNPGLAGMDPVSAATLYSLSTSSDVIKSLTEYIAADADARAFLDGAKDPWGMQVNPFFKGVVVPTSQWPSLDTQVLAATECEKRNPVPYLPAVAAPVQSMETIANAVLDGWPLSAVRCDDGIGGDPDKVGRVPREKFGLGGRFVIGLTSLGDAQRLDLHSAALNTSSGRFVSPDLGGLSAAIATAKPGKKLQAWSLDQAKIRKAGKAYPGTMLVYTAARTSGMKKADAAKVAQFIEVSTTEGQVLGRGNGQLPAGYLPLRKSGVTAKLWEQAQAAAQKIRAQKAPAQAQPGSRPKTAAGASTPDAKAPLGAPPAAPAATAAGPGALGASTPLATAKTTPVSSRIGSMLLPLLLGLGLLAGLVAGLGRLSLRRQGIR